MTPLHLTVEDVKAETEWEVSGTSPANSPQAILQYAQLALEGSADPRSGIDVYSLWSVIIKHSPLKNAKIQISQEENAQRVAAGILAQQAGAMGQPSGPGEVQPDPGNTGGFPPSPLGPGGA